MRKLIIAAAIAAASLSPAAFADGGAAKYSTATTTIGEIMENEATKAAFEKVMPELATNPDLAQGYDFTLVDVQSYVPDQITDDKLKELDAELAKIE